MAAPASPTAPSEALEQTQDRFVAAWGGMAGAWGVSRTMAEAHALLYITGRPLNTDDIMARLGISRGNASTTLRALVDWGLATRTHKRGDRKEYFVGEQDVWSMLRTIIRERKKRELDPLMQTLQSARDAVRARPIAGESGAALSRRLDAMLEFVGVFDRLAGRMALADGAELRQAALALSLTMAPPPAPRASPISDAKAPTIRRART